MKTPETYLAAWVFWLSNMYFTQINNQRHSNIRRFVQDIISKVRPIGQVKYVATGR